MEQILEESGALSLALLSTDEAQYDQKALDLISKLSKLSTQDMAIREHLDVRPGRIHMA